MLRRTTAILGTTAVLALGVMTPARAEAPELESYAAGATGTALQLTLLGQQLAVSQTNAALSSTPNAAADGAALLLAGTPVPGSAPSAAPEGPATNESCPLELDLDEVTQGALSALQLEVACFTTSASTEGGPAAEAGSGEVVIRVLAPGGDLVEPLLGPVLDGLTSVTDPLVEALDPLLGAINDVTEIDVPDVLDQLTTALDDDTFVLVEIVVAPSVSHTVANTADGVVAEAGSNGLTIKLLPGLESTLAGLVGLIDIPSPAPELLKVTLGSSTARVVRDAATGEASTEGSAAQLASVSAGDSLGILGDVADQLTGAIDQLAAAGAPLSCEGGALADVICVDLGAVNELDAAELEARNMNFGEGTVGVEATAASIRVLPVLADVLGGDVLGLSLATSTAAANATAPALPRSAPPAPPAPPALPKTGGESGLTIALALFAVAGAGGTLVRRTRRSGA